MIVRFGFDFTPNPGACLSVVSLVNALSIKPPIHRQQPKSITRHFRWFLASRMNETYLQCHRDERARSCIMRMVKSVSSFVEHVLFNLNIDENGFWKSNNAIVLLPFEQMLQVVDGRWRFIRKERNIIKRWVAVSVCIVPGSNWAQVSAKKEIMININDN